MIRTRINDPRKKTNHNTLTSVSLQSSHVSGKFTGPQSRYFELSSPSSTKLQLNRRNSSLPKQKNTKEIIINHKGTRMIKDGED